MVREKNWEFRSTDSARTERYFSAILPANKNITARNPRQNPFFRCRTKKTATQTIPLQKAMPTPCAKLMSSKKHAEI